MIWKAINGYEGRYEISNTGLIKSLSRVRLNGGINKEKILKNSINLYGYNFVCLCINRVNKRRMVHRLVAEAFIGSAESCKDINHINEIKTDNRVENLEWVNKRQNCNKYKNKRSASKYPGVAFHKAANKWVSRIQFNGVVKYLGIFSNELEAFNAYSYFCNENNIKYK